MESGRRTGAARGTGGQVIVEVLLVLPVFLLLTFSIMEIGHLAFRTILLHHAAYEVARYGSLTCPNTFKASKVCDQPNPDTSGMRAIAKKILPTAQVDVAVRATLSDPQPQPPCMNHDIVVTLTQQVPMIFPMTGMIFADKGSRARTLRAAVPMPVERPLFR